MAEPEIYFRVPEMPGLRDALGRYTSAQREQLERNRRMAVSMQGDVVRRMANHIAFGRRAAVSTNRLLRVTAESRNVYATKEAFGIGRPDFLNSSVAKYWRTFEEGSAAVWRHPFAGTQLRGRFGGSIIGWAPTRTPGPQPQPLAGGPWNAAGGKLRWYWSMPLNPNFRVTREIQPAHIYRDVARDAHLSEFGVHSAMLIMQKVFAAGLNPSEPLTGFYNKR